MLKVLEVALSQVGYCENPPSSNETKYGVWFGLNRVPWCGIFVSYVFSVAGFTLPVIGFYHGFASCEKAVDYFRKNKCLVSVPIPGDIVFFDFDGNGRFDHTGIYFASLPNNSFQSIEGNTSESNNANGGCVMVRTRLNKNCLFARPVVFNQ